MARTAHSTASNFIVQTSAITAINLTFGNAGSGSSAVTASISPGTNKLDIVSVTGSTSQVPTVTGAGGTWVLIGSQFDGGGTRGVHMFRDLSGSPGSGALTVDFGGVTQSFIGWSVDEFSNTNASGTHGSAAIAQSVGTNSAGTSTGITATLAALSSPSNAAYGFVRNNAVNAIVVGSGFSQLSNQLAAEVAAEWSLNQTAVAWSWASQSVTSVTLAIEIRAQ